MSSQNYFSLLRNFDAELSRRYRVAVQPDHPFMFGGPDLLAGADGALHAIFIEKCGEEKNSNYLLTRLAKARLALPSHTLCHLVRLPSDLVGNDHDLSMASFDGIVESREAQDLLATMDAAKPKHVEALTKTRTQASQRASILMKAALRFGKDRKQSGAVARVFHDFKEKFKACAFCVPSWSSKSGRCTSKYVMAEGVMATSVRFSDRLSVRSMLQPVFDTGLRVDYSMDNGIPYPHFSTIKTIFVDEIPFVPNDPLKPIRCAAFFGWVMVTPGSIGDYERMIMHLRQWLHIRGERGDSYEHIQKES